MPELMQLTGLSIKTERLGELGESYLRAGSSRGSLGVQVVSEEVLASTRRPDCKCEDPVHMASLGLQPLRAGTLVRGPGGLQGISPEWHDDTKQWVPIEGGLGLGSGCQTGSVCTRLTDVRKRYGV